MPALQSSAVINLHADGTASVITGSVDVGGSRASMAMIAAEVLGLGIDQVRPMVGDTDSIGHTDVTGGSRTTLATGQAVYEAAHDVIRQLKERAAILWEKKPEEVEFTDGIFRAEGEGITPMTVAQLARKLARTGGPVSGRASINARNVGPAFAATMVDVEVDPDTGKLKILRCTIAQDAGKAIHPSYVEGQMQGGTAQGLGWALNEEYVYDSKGILRNIGLLDYRMPTCLDLPMIETIVVEVANPGASTGHPRRGRSFDRAAAGRARQRDLPRDWRTHDRFADVTAAHPQSDDGTSRDGAGDSIAPRRTE